MKKKIEDVTFEEFDDWCNRRACDGRWDIVTALSCCQICNEVLSVRPLFGREKAREKRWNELKVEHFEADAEIEL